MENLEDIIQGFKLHHVGVVAKKKRMMEIFLELFGSKIESSYFVKEYQAECFMTRLNNIKIEFIVPQGGPLKEFRGGIHHIAIETEKPIEEVVSILKKKDVVFTNEESVQGIGNIKINFIHPVSTGGVIIELVNPPKDG